MENQPVYQIGVRHTPPQSQKVEAKVKAKAVKVKAVTVSESTVKPVQTEAYQYNVLVVRLAELQWAKDGPVVASKSEILEQVHFYDSRVVIEMASIKADKQGLGLVKRRKFNLAGQEMLLLLAQLAHNLVMSAKGWLAALEPELETFGVQRLVRDLFAIGGAVTFKLGRIVKVQLNQRNSLARRFHKPLEKYFATLNIQVALGGG